MNKVFLDANVLYAATKSKTGGSSVIITLALKGKLQVYVSTPVLREAEKNLRQKESLIILREYFQLLNQLKPSVVTLSDKEISGKWSAYMTDPQDLHVLEAADKAKVNYLVTLDQKHFFSPSIKNASLPFIIVTPGGLLESIAA